MSKFGQGDRDEQGTGAPLGAELFEAVPVPTAPEDFAARVVAAAMSESQPVTPRPAMGAVALAVAAAAVALWLGRGGPGIGGAGADQGDAEARERTTWALGDRALAVGERGARVRWQRGPAGLSVVQEEGSVFYRVDGRRGPFARPESFEVKTPAGVVLVTGTCFRVEVTPMNLAKDKRLLLAAGGGALVASLVVVSVYEGRVRFGNASGSVAVAAGERASARGTAETPRLEDEPAQAAQGTGASSAIGLARPPALVNAEPGPQEQQEIERLRQRVRELEQAGRSAGGRGDSAPGRESNYVDPSKEELLERAKTCGLAWDMPQIDRADDMSAKEAERFGLSEDERQIANDVRKAFNRRNMGELRKLYVEVTGDSKAADLLSAAGLQQEIVAKSPDGEAPEVFKRLSHERAGLMPPPAPGTPSPPLERMMRLLTGMGDKFEQDLAAQLGPARAHEMRLKEKGWGSRSGSSHGCPGQRN